MSTKREIYDAAGSGLQALDSAKTTFLSLENVIRQMKVTPNSYYDSIREAVGSLMSSISNMLYLLPALFLETFSGHSVAPIISMAQKISELSGTIIEYRQNGSIPQATRDNLLKQIKTALDAIYEAKPKLERLREENYEPYKICPIM